MTSRILETDETLLPPELLARLERLELVSRKIFRGRLKGERRSRRKGQSVEFADFRSYVPGDDLRFIDWNLYARLDRFYLKLFLEEEDLHFYALIDNSRSMDFGTPNKLRYAQQLAAALGFIGLCRTDRVRIESLSAARRTAVPTLRGRRNLPLLLQSVTSIGVAEHVSLEQGLKQFCLRTSGKGVVVLFSDLLEKTGYETAFRYLLAQSFDIFVVQILSPEELRPELAGDLKLVDCEDAEIAEITASRPLLDRYQRTLAAFLQRAQQFCHRRGITHVHVSTETPVDYLVTSLLQRRGLVRS